MIDATGESTDLWCATVVLQHDDGHLGFDALRGAEAMQALVRDGVVVEQLLKTIYLGDRGCKGISIESWQDRVVVHVTVISRVRSTSGQWDYYTDEDIPDGRLAFTDVSSFRMDPPGPIPNDFINDLRVKDEPSDSRSERREYVFVLSVSSGDRSGASTEVTIEIRAGGLHLEDPARAGVIIISRLPKRERGCFSIRTTPTRLQ